MLVCFLLKRASGHVNSSVCFWWRKQKNKLQLDTTILKFKYRVEYK